MSMYEVESKKIVRERFPRFGFESHQYPNAIGMWPNEQESLVWAALNAEAGSWMEIGSFCGGSAVLLCLARRYHNLGPAVYSVDRNFDGWRGAFDRNVYKIGKFDDISVKIACDSRNLQKNYRGDSLSLVFIDGWHSFDGVLSDYNQVKPFLTENALLVFHDTAPQPYKPGQLDQYAKKAEVLLTKDVEQVEIDRQYKTLADYHASEAEQDFLIDEALAHIAKTEGFEYVPIPILDGVTHFDRVPIYKHGTTSPYHGLVILRKIGK